MSGRTLPFILSTLGLALVSTGVFANHPQRADNALFVTIPNTQQGIEIGLTGLALKPGASNLNYVIYNKALPAQSPGWTEKEISQNFGPAFDLSLRYIACGGKDLSLDWVHLNVSQSTSVAAPNDEFFLGPDFEIGPPAIPIRNAAGSSQFKYDVINLEAGQSVDFGRDVEFRFFGGLSTTYLRELVHATYSGDVATPPFEGPFSTKQKVTARFSGVGPRVGMEGHYNIMDSGFGVVGKGAISALIGQSYAHTAYVSTSTQLKDTFDQDLNYQTIQDKSIRQVIPGLDGKLGVYYKHQFGNSLFSLETGYQAAVYINAIQQYLPGSLVDGQSIDAGGIFVATMSHTQSNYSVQGPYLGATWQF